MHVKVMRSLQYLSLQSLYSTTTLSVKVTINIDIPFSFFFSFSCCIENWGLIFVKHAHQVVTVHQAWAMDLRVCCHTLLNETPRVEVPITIHLRNSLLDLEKHKAVQIFPRLGR